MKKYDYLVSYIFNKEGYLTPCHGTTQISRTKKIKTFEDLDALNNFITKNLNMEDISNLSIYNIIFLGRNKH